MGKMGCSTTDGKAICTVLPLETKIKTKQGHLLTFTIKNKIHGLVIEHSCVPDLSTHLAHTFGGNTNRLTLYSLRYDM